MHGYYYGRSLQNNALCDGIQTSQIPGAVYIPHSIAILEKIQLSEKQEENCISAGQGMTT